MRPIELLDTFPRFERIWPSFRDQSTAKQIEGWAQSYLVPWPDLLAKQIDSYFRDGVDWRSVARRRVFPALESRLPAMQRIHRVLLRQIPRAARQIGLLLGVDFPIRCVIYVGIGCGAGWATTYRGVPAILFGLENAAELDWSDPTTIRALVAHEMAHLVHDRWWSDAKRNSLASGRGPWWSLYEEGFATRCELKVGPPGRLHSTVGKADWLPWCRANQRRLARAFLNTVERRRSTRQFFGSWYPFRGHIESGYFLGSEIVRDWEAKSSLSSIGRWESSKVRQCARASLRRMAWREAFFNDSGGARAGGKPGSR
jgi:hypothetical protein